MLTTVAQQQKHDRAVMNCHHCGRSIETLERLGFRDYCPSCDWALHVCLNCGFHAPEYHNECRETQAASVVDKARFNFCDYFRPAPPVAAAPSARAPATGLAVSRAPSNTRAQLDALFRKKSS
jgi:predicted RNA-binding Zn-ribbon protein involved in translation (DUF1610 family)